MSYMIVKDENGVPRRERMWVRPLDPMFLTIGTMTKERAQYVIENRVRLADGSFAGFKYSFDHEWACAGSRASDGINEVEDAFVKMTWSLMGNDKSYYDAVVAIAKGT